MTEKPEILEAEIIAKSRLFDIEQVHLRFSNGNERYYERLMGRSNGAVLIVPMLDDETFLLVREYAVGSDRYELGFPKGVIEHGENALETAQRELMEEVGYGARELTELTRVTVAPGFWQNSTVIVLAKELYPANLQGDEPEKIQVVSWRLNNMRDLLVREDFSESRSIAALFFLKEMFR